MGHAAAGLPGATAAPAGATVATQAKSIQNNVRDATEAALKQGADRAAQQANQ